MAGPSARGWHPFNSFYDEADFAANALLTIVLPLQAEKNHVLFALSSPNTQGGLYSDMINAKDENGKNLLNVVIIGQACDACRRSGLWFQCTHTDRGTATWKDPEKTSRLNAIYEACNMKSILDSELGGSMIGGLVPVYVTSVVAALRSSFDKPENYAPRDIDIAICCIDPAGGGKGSELAIVIYGVSSRNNKQWVMLMAAEKLDGELEHMEQLVYGSVQRFREIDGMKAIPLIIAIEGNSNDATYWAQGFRDPKHFNDLIVMAEVAGGKRWGVPKDARTSLGLVSATKQALCFRQIVIPRTVVSFCTRRRGAAARSTQEMVNHICTQLGNYRFDPKSGHYGGKVSGPDDLAIAFMMGPYWFLEFCASEKEEYVAFKLDYGDVEMWRTCNPETIARLDDTVK